jgi:hypothetical protein
MCLSGGGTQTEEHQGGNFQNQSFGKETPAGVLMGGHRELEQGRGGDVRDGS